MIDWIERIFARKGNLHAKVARALYRGQQW